MQRASSLRLSFLFLSLSFLSYLFLVYATPLFRSHHTIPLNTYIPPFLSCSWSHVAGSENLAYAPLSPSVGSKLGSTQSLRGWIIPKLTVELQRRGIPFPATARKAKLFRLLFPPPRTAKPIRHPCSRTPRLSPSSTLWSACCPQRSPMSRREWESLKCTQ